MDYEKAYKESFNIAKCWHEAGDTTTKKQMERLFPQLVESDDERNLKKVKRAIRGFFTNPTDANELLTWLEKQKEQKPAEWSEEDGRILKGIIGLIDHDQHYEVGNKEMLNWIKSLPERFNLQPKQEWSDEDEKIINTIISLLGQYIDYKSVSGNSSGYATPRYGKEIDWLKSIRPQPKQEWSEEDAEMFVNVAASLRVYACGLESEEYKRHIKKEIDWFENRFKSLRPQPHWKPSKEQMDALKDALETYNGFEEYDAMKSLYNDLKKL